MASLFSFATRAGRSCNVLQHQIAELKANLPTYVTALDAHPCQGPAEWLISKLDACPCGNCGVGDSSGGGGSSSSTSSNSNNNLPTTLEPCWFVDAVIVAPTGDSCYGHGSYRLRTIVTHSFGSDAATQAATNGESWPLICRFMGAETTPLHLGVDQDDGSVKDEMLELFAESSTLGTENPPGSLRAALLVCHRLLSSVPPEDVFGPSVNNAADQEQPPGPASAIVDLPPSPPSEVHLKWMSFAMGHKSRAETLARYRGDNNTKGLFRNPALIDPSLAPALNDHEAWGPSSALAQQHFGGAGILDPELFTALAAMRDGRETPLKALLREESLGVYSFPLFSPAFCEALVAELASFEASGLPASRPNSMNNYGVVVNLIGLGPFMDSLQEEVAKPIAERLFGAKRAAASAADADSGSMGVDGNDDDDEGTSIGEGDWLDSHHTFSVRYTSGEDLGLDVHTDDSDVTLNVCLGEPGFQGSGLVFCGGLGAPDHRTFRKRYKHVLGRCVVHLGRQRHGADDITAGVRTNLIMWNKSMAHRRVRALNPPPYEREGAPPSAECLSFTHDRDYSSQAARFASGAAAAGSGDDDRDVTLKPRPVFSPPGWCPPAGREYRPHSLSHLP